MQLCFDLLPLLAPATPRAEPSEAICPRTSSEVTRRIQIGKNHLMTIPRRCLSSGTEGKTIIPAKMVLQQIADILKTPVILAGVISPGASIPKALPQVTEEKEGKCNAGGPAEGNDANAQLVKSILQQITGILKTPVVQAGVVSPGASGSPALLQVTEEEEEEGSAGDPIGLLKGKAEIYELHPKLCRNVDVV